MKPTLVIASKNYSSWSMRPWVLMRALGIDFDEVVLRLRSPEFAPALRAYGPTAATVPLLRDGAVVVGDSLAIVEHLAETRPDAGVWPRDAQLRATARHLCATMHSGFATLRQQLPMNIEACLPGRGWNLAVQRDVDRITALWRDALERSGGPFLAGTFCAADAFFAPVATRMRTYGVELPADAMTYAQQLLQLPAVRQWCDQAQLEHDFIAALEPYRVNRD